MTMPNANTAKGSTEGEDLMLLRGEIETLKFQLIKKDQKIANLETLFSTISKSHNDTAHAYRDLEDKFLNVVDMLRKRVPHGDILEHLKVKDANEFQFKKLW